jgi:hypothetical protein
MQSASKKQEESGTRAQRVGAGGQRRTWLRISPHAPKLGHDPAGREPFKGVDKTSVLQDIRVFNESQLNVRKCSAVLGKVLYLLGRGEKFSKTEQTEVFFSATKLFQSKDERMRRLLYLVIKDLSPSQDEVIIVTSTLTKDMTSKSDLLRANATRVLCTITDVPPPLPRPSPPPPVLPPCPDRALPQAVPHRQAGRRLVRSPRVGPPPCRRQRGRCAAVGDRDQ